MTGGIIHPWRLLRERAHVTLAWHDDGPMGFARHSTQTISLRRGLDWAQRRCTVMHELIHLERGPALSTTRDQDEERVRRETARRMLPDISRVGEAIAWAFDEHECADELGVDVGVLRYRLRHMHPAERHYPARRLEED
jgi:hypothetical protein